MDTQTKDGKRDLIFIIEDNEMYSMMVEYILSVSDCYRFVKLSSGEDGIANLYQKPDAIILDYYLPGMNGLNTFKKIKEKLPDVPVIVLSKNRDEATAAKLLEAGVDGFIPKEKNSIEQLKINLHKIIDSKKHMRVKRNKQHTTLITLAILCVIMILLFMYQRVTQS